MAKARTATAAQAVSPKTYVPATLSIEGVDQPVEIRLYPRHKEGKERDFTLTGKASINGTNYRVNGYFSTEKKDGTGPAIAVSFGKTTLKTSSTIQV